ncbi:hypothetical protein O6H91_11G056500 [Diphasiastrum complanatum]|uniref:Uncharacterized protein n=1 Tax=Diphasiastrum complanatum TaxID=34168 RepID=A0ACC2C9S1_DIPCM|nr:hypothetical protein O6H91_11G056500 [Diphasiastrum complanatum]
MLTNVILKGAQVETSKITLSNSSISIYASGVQAKLVFHWSYSCTTSYVPFPIKDGGVAYVEVRGGKAGVDFAIEEDNGTLILDVSKCETYLEELDIDLHDGVSWLYKWFAGILQWLVDSLPKQTLLNTASWKYVIPQLYKKYPNMDMMLNFSVSTTPDISIARNGIHATAALTISMNAIAAMNGNNITAEATLKDLILELKWSEIGSFPVKLVQAAVRTVVTDVILPLLNFNLRKGFPLPIIPSVELQAADIRYGNSFLLVCTDVHYTNDLTFVLVIEKLTNLLISS